MRKDFNIFDSVNEIGKEVEEVLESRKEERYFEEIMLLYSLIENLLKWLVFVEVSRSRNWWEGELSKEDVDNFRQFCRQLRFYDALNIGLFIKLIPFKLYKEIDKVKKERIDVTHQLWIYQNRKEPVKLRENLEMLVGVAKELAWITQGSVNEVDVDVDEIEKIRL